MKNLLFYIFALVCIHSLSSCQVEGCMDKASHNYNFEATIDNGTCEFSNVVFYGAVFSPCPPVKVHVAGIDVGTITWAYPNGPGNCSVPGVANFTFDSGDTVDWIATDACGFVFSGTARPLRDIECIKVRVF